MATKKSPLETAQKLEKKGDVDGALTAYHEALKQAPKDGRLLLKVAELEEKAGRGNDANATFRRLGALHLEEGHLARGVSVLRRAHKLVPSDPATAMMLGDALAQEGKQRDAVVVLRASSEAAVARNDRKASLALLERAVAIQNDAVNVVALAQALLANGQLDSAARTLREVADRLRTPTTGGDRVRVLEQLYELTPEDTRVAVEAARAALELRDARRGIVIVRRALDEKPQDPDLVLLAGLSLELYGDGPRAARVFKEAARLLSRANRPNEAREAWVSVLRVASDDVDAQRALAPSLAPDLPKLLARREALLDQIDADEAEGALSALDGAPPGGPQLEVAPEVLETGFTLLLDHQPGANDAADVAEAAFGISKVGDTFVLETGPALAKADEEPVLSLVLDAQPTTQSPTLPARLALPAAPLSAPAQVERAGRQEPTEPPAASPQVRRRRRAQRPTGPTTAPKVALVVGDGPEAGWALQALADLGIHPVALPSSQLNLGAERAAAANAEVVVSGPGAAEAFAGAGPWLAAGPVQVERSALWEAARRAGVLPIEVQALREPADLTSALERLGAPLDIVSELGARLRVASSASPEFHLKLAEETLGVPLYAVPAAEPVWVVVAGDGERAVGLGEFSTEQVEGVELYVSPSGPGEDERLTVAVAAAQALGLRGVAVVRLSKTPTGWACDSMEEALGPGALAVESRLDVQLVSLGVALGRGGALPEPQRRGVAHATHLPMGALGSFSNVRIESGQDGTVFLCAHAADAAQSSRRLLRARKPDG